MSSNKQPSSTQKPSGVSRIGGFIPEEGMTSSNKNKNSIKERASRAVHINKFAHAKSQGTKRAIEKYREKQQAKFLNKAKLLRTYQKTMKQEGYEPGIGASRKRTQEQQNSHDKSQQDFSQIQKPKTVQTPESTRIQPWTTLDDDDDDEDDTMIQNKKNNKRRKMMMDPLAKAKAISQQERKELELQKLQKEEHLKNKEKKKIQRDIQSRHMRQRTQKTGQPVMKYVIQNMLDKIRKT